MNSKQAIEELKCYRAKSGTEYPEEIELAISALEKQIPKKLTKSNMTTICPECGHAIKRCYDFCPECGQCIDWND